MIQEGLCTDEEYDKCVKEFGTGRELEWTCDHCPKIRDTDLHPYTVKLLENRLLKLGGYPFSANDFTPEEWIDLGRLEQCLATPAPSK